MVLCFIQSISPSTTASIILPTSLKKKRLFISLILYTVRDTLTGWRKFIKRQIELHHLMGWNKFSLIPARQHLYIVFLAYHKIISLAQKLNNGKNCCLF
ncbi:hypothetical protein T4C_5563 [Trichinella pseudospiralis]|uniref:Uncharacterized protein n=1 Tax=Trichinella pseudospiralis TaxID=6337 RepID=A0A0V1JU94_TRIPS|nr:hypothetical protein T4C_5563 [Trichinella pseudospiralis]